MRLLNTSTLKLESFSSGVPEYAILSHTWDDKEIIFEDVRDDPTSWQSKPGAMKVLNSAARALMDDFEYIWIDTICIDKTSSAELSESINSMFKWYANASVCYAFLADVKKEGDISKCRWFTRGWTLQELIAPPVVIFFDRDWLYMGDRLSLVDDLVSITRIDQSILARPQLHYSVEHMLENYSISRRMSWAGNRETQKEEDKSYSLLGLFGVNMPLLYGEGFRAFRRLQEEIVKQSDDQSIPAYRETFFNFDIAQFFCDDPAFFLPGVEQDTHAQKSKVYFANGGLSVQLLICPCIMMGGSFIGESIWLGILGCVVDSDYLSRPAILLQQSYKDDSSRYWRLWPSTLHIIGPELEGRVGSLRDRGFDDKITFNLGQAQSRRITIIEPSREHAYAAGDAHPLPLRINTIKQPPHRCFEKDSGHPDQSGSFVILKDSGNSSPWLDPVMGILSFHERGSNHFILVWGLIHSTISNTKLPWCRVYPLRELEIDASNGKNEAELVEEIITLFKKRDDRLKHLLVPKKGFQRETNSEATISNDTVTVCATLRKVSLLGRHICDLQVTINENL